MEDKETVDGIIWLGDMGLLNVIEKIFEYNDFKDVKNADQVSEEWQEILLHTNLWKIMLRKKVSSSAEWEKMHMIMQSMHSAYISKMTDFEAARWLFLQIESAIERLSEKWKVGNCKTREMSCDPSIVFRHDPSRQNEQDPDLFEVNSKWIARGSVDDRIYLYNRWSLQLEHVFEYPFPDELLSTNRPFLRAIHMNDECLLGEYSTKVFFQWDLETKTRLREMKFARVDLSNYCRTIRLRGNKAIFHTMNVETVPLPGVPCTHQFKFFTLNKESGLQPEVEGHKDFLRHAGRPSLYAVYDFDFDDSFLVIFYRNDDSYAVDIRSNSIYRSYSYTIVMFETSSYAIYSAGLLAQHTFNGDTCASLKIMKANRGSQGIGSIKSTRPIQSARFVKDKYLITCSNDGQISVWDLQSALYAGSAAINDGLLVDSLGQLSMLNTGSSVKRELLFADGFQIILRSFPGQTDSDLITTLNFVGEPQV